MHEANEMNETSQTNQMNEMNELNEMNKTNEMYETSETNETNDMTEMNDMNEINEMNDMNEKNDMNDMNLSETIDDMNEMNVNKMNEMTEMTDMTEMNNLKDRTRGPRFVRACEIEMQSKISQEPLHTEIYRKNAAPQNEPRTRTHILCEPAQSKRMSRFHTSHLMRKFSGKMRAPEPRRRRYAKPAQSHVKISQEPLHTEIYRKDAATQIEPRTRTHTLCASLRSRNACQDFTRDALYKNLQVTDRRRE